MSDNGNVLKQKLVIQETVHPETKKHYFVYTYFYIANNGPRKGFHCAEFYVTDANPKHGLLVKYGEKAFAPEEFELERATEIVEKLTLEKLYDGVARFEAIMSHGMDGNEYEC